MIAVVALVASFCVSLLFLARNHWVHNERVRILTGIAVVAYADLQADRDWEWRYEIYHHGPSHYRMVFEAWKPISSYRSEFKEALCVTR